MIKNYKIIRNSARCKRCNIEIVSRYCHDYVSCPCGAIFVDGGNEYIRSGYKGYRYIEPTHITEPDILPQLKEKYSRYEEDEDEIVPLTKCEWITTQVKKIPYYVNIVVFYIPYFLK